MTVWTTGWCVWVIENITFDTNTYQRKRKWPEIDSVLSLWKRYQFGFPKWIDIDIYQFGFPKWIDIEQELHVAVKRISIILFLTRHQDLHQHRLLTRNTLKVSHSEMEELRVKGLWFKCDEVYTRGHECKHLFRLDGVYVEEDQEQDTNTWIT